MCRGGFDRAGWNEYVQHLGRTDPIDDVDAGALAPAPRDLHGQRLTRGIAQPQRQLRRVGSARSQGARRRASAPPRIPSGDAPAGAQQSMPEWAARPSAPPCRPPTTEGERIAEAVREEQFGGRQHHIALPQSEGGLRIQGRRLDQARSTCTVPLGAPVEPDEYSQKHGSSHSVGAGSNTSPPGRRAVRAARASPAKAARLLRDHDVLEERRVRQNRLKLRQEFLRQRPA